MDAQGRGRRVAAVGWTAGMLVTLVLVWVYLGSMDYLLIVAGAGTLGLLGMLRRTADLT